MTPSAFSLFAETLGASTPALVLFLADKKMISLPKEKTSKSFLVRKLSG